MSPPPPSTVTLNGYRQTTYALGPGDDWRAPPFPCLSDVGFRPLFLSLVSVSGDGVYIRAELESLPSQASNMLVVRTEQLTTGDLHPIRLAALSAAPTRHIRAEMHAKTRESPAVTGFRSSGSAYPLPPRVNYLAHRQLALKSGLFWPVEAELVVPDHCTRAQSYILHQLEIVMALSTRNFRQKLGGVRSLSLLSRYHCMKGNNMEKMTLNCSCIELGTTRDSDLIMNQFAIKRLCLLLSLAVLFGLSMSGCLMDVESGEYLDESVVIDAESGEYLDEITDINPGHEERNEDTVVENHSLYIIYENSFESPANFSGWLVWHRCGVDGSWSVKRKSTNAPGGNWALRMKTTGFKAGCTYPGVYALSGFILATQIAGKPYYLDNMSRNSNGSGKTRIIFYDGNLRQIAAYSRSWSSDTWKFNSDARLSVVVPTNARYFRIRYRLATANRVADLDLLRVALPI